MVKDKISSDQGLIAFKTLHAVYHERDFRVRVNDPTINFVRRQLQACVADKVTAENDECPACAAGFEPFEEQPNDEDRRR